MVLSKVGILFWWDFVLAEASHMLVAICYRSSEIPFRIGHTVTFFESWWWICTCLSFWCELSFGLTWSYMSLGQLLSGPLLHVPFSCFSESVCEWWVVTCYYLAIMWLLGNSILHQLFPVIFYMPWQRHESLHSSQALWLPLKCCYLVAFVVK